MKSNYPKLVTLAAPKLEAENIKEKVACIRGHRERIFQTCAQQIDDKLVFHNYGQGGAGWTFLFGCVNESLRQFEEQIKTNPTMCSYPSIPPRPTRDPSGRTDIILKNKNIAIIGAGCYGLLTAIELVRKGYSVKIYAKDTENIPSNKAAGFFFPRHRKCSTDEEKEIFKIRGIESYKTYKLILDGLHPFIKSGPKLLPAYFEPSIDPGFAPYIAEGLVDKPEEVTINFTNSKKFYDAIEYKIIFINSAEIMRELKRNIKELNISIEQKEIQSFNNIEEKIIFNCSGFGAKELTGDQHIVPVQGHLITLQNQKIEALQYMLNFKVFQPTLEGKPRDELIYFAPREEGILGVTFKRGESSPDANQHEFERLLERCRKLFS